MSRRDIAVPDPASSLFVADAAPTSGSAARSQDRIIGFDLLRGVAALLVLVYHVDFAFGLRGSLLVGGYLAVDLFFVLSGFVLALNYREAIRDGRTGLRDFAVARLARLYPLFLVTTAVGIPVALARLASQNALPEPGAAAITALLNLAVLPSFWFRAGGSALFPFNAASWSIFFELVASLAFFVVLARLQLRSLVMVTLAGLAGLGWVLARYGQADVGYDTVNIWAGFARVAFSFCMGLLLFELWSRKSWRASPVSLFLALGAFLALVQLKLFVPTDLTPWLDLVLVALLIPGLVAIGAGVRLQGSAAALATFLGDISYSVYLAQGPVILLMAGLCKRITGAEIASFSPWSGLALVAVVIAIAYAGFHLVEVPARRWIRRRWSGKSAAR